MLGPVGHARSRQMQVARRGADVAVTQPLLQAVQIEAGLQQVGGIAVAQRVDAPLLGNACIRAGGTVPALRTLH